MYGKDLVEIVMLQLQTIKALLKTPQEDIVTRIFEDNRWNKVCTTLTFDGSALFVHNLIIESIGEKLALHCGSLCVYDKNDMSFIEYQPIYADRRERYTLTEVQNMYYVKDCENDSRVKFISCRGLTTILKKIIFPEKSTNFWLKYGMYRIEILESMLSSAYLLLNENFAAFEELAQGSKNNKEKWSTLELT